MWYNLNHCQPLLVLKASRPHSLILTGLVKSYLWDVCRWQWLVLSQPLAWWSLGPSAQILPGSPTGKKPTTTYKHWDTWHLKHCHTWREDQGADCTMGRQLTWRLAMGTEMVFPWWFMAVTSTTLLSSLASSPRQTCSSNIPMKNKQWLIGVHDHTD